MSMSQNSSLRVIAVSGASVDPYGKFMGNAGVGKSTVGDLLSRSPNFHALIALAEPLKQIALILHGVPLEVTREAKEQKGAYGPDCVLPHGGVIRVNASPRELLQRLGTEMFRERWGEVLAGHGLLDYVRPQGAGEASQDDDPDLAQWSQSLWVNLARRRIEHAPEGTFCVVTDLRFTNDLREFIRAFGPDGVVHVHLRRRLHLAAAFPEQEPSGRPHASNTEELWFNAARVPKDLQCRRALIELPMFGTQGDFLRELERALRAIPEVGRLLP